MLIKLPLTEVLVQSLQREVWMCKEAQWSKLKDTLTQFDWAPLKEGSAENALSFFLETLWYALVKYIPRKWVK